jgi:hypothetical protein
MIWLINLIMPARVNRTVPPRPATSPEHKPDFGPEYDPKLDSVMLRRSLYYRRELFAPLDVETMRAQIAHIGTWQGVTIHDQPLPGCDY